MSKKVKKICAGISVFFMLCLFIEAGFMFPTFAVYIPIAVMLCAALVTGICIFGIVKNKDFFFKFGIVGGFFGVIGVGIYMALEMTGVSAMLSDSANLQEFIDKAGIWAPIVYIVIQFAQVTLVPIPSTVTVIAGTMVFDLVEVVLYSTIGLTLGAMFAFMLGRVFGVKLVVWIVGEKAFNKYQKIIKGRDKTMLFLMFLFPVFPDDLLCLIAGITTMSYSTFLLMQIVTRPLGVLMSSAGGELFKLIPFEGWYLAIWAVLALLVIAMFILVWKYSGKIEEKLVKFFMSRMGKNSSITIDEKMLKSEVKNLVGDTSVVSQNNFKENLSDKAPDKKKKKYIVNYK